MTNISEDGKNSNIPPGKSSPEENRESTPPVEWLPTYWLDQSEEITPVTGQSVEELLEKPAKTYPEFEFGFLEEGGFYAIIDGVPYSDLNMIPPSASRNMIRLFIDQLSEARKQGVLNMRITMSMPEEVFSMPVLPDPLRPANFSVGNAVGGAVGGAFSMFKRKPLSSSNSNPPLPTASLATVINRIINRRLESSNITLDYEIKVVDNPDGGIAIKYGPELYQSVSEMPEGPALELVRLAVDEWNNL